jgi:divalent metal cation (Fe/Co/Zn/Cd) transporter
LVVGFAMIAAAIGIAAESINLIRTPHKLPQAYTLLVLICVVPIKGLLSRYVSGVSQKIESSALRGDAWHHLSDAIVSAFAFIGISAALWTGNPTADDWAACWIRPQPQRLKNMCAALLRRYRTCLAWKSALCAR